MNTRRRSKLLNTEMGVLVDCPALAQETARYFDHAADPDSSFHGELQGEHLEWSWNQHGTPMSSRSEPEVSSVRRVEFDLLRLLPIQGLM